MEVVAVHKNARMTPQKLRPLSRILVGLPVVLAQQQLQSWPGKAPGLLSAVLKSAVANASHNHDLKPEDLIVSKIQIGAGLVMKRFMPRSRGMAYGIWKRTSHITIAVGEKTPGMAKPKKAKKTAIEEMTAQEYAERKLTEATHEHEETKEGEETDVKAKGQGAVPVEQRQDKQNYEAFQRTKMMQQGGDQKKTHRRKSLSSGS